MTIARSAQIDLDSTPYYHLINRCVRRAFLCGKDKNSKQSYEHRKPWVVDHLGLISQVFAIDVVAYAVMSNHYHVIVHVDREKALAWTRQEVIERWQMLYGGSQFARDYLGSLESAELCNESKLIQLDKLVEEWRERLYSISWFMGNLNESIARRANKEDECKGRFWEGRFKNQALLDETALLTCMMYVDLNPIRAAMTSKLEESDFTSIQQRLYQEAHKKRNKKNNQGRKKTKNKAPQAICLLPFSHPPRNQTQNKKPNEPDKICIPFRLTDYFELIDWTGRSIRDDKKGHIGRETPNLLQQLNLDPESLINTIERFESRFKYSVGSLENMLEYALKVGKNWVQGLGSSRLLYAN